MSSISGISSAWSNMSAMHGHRPPGGMDPAKMFAKVDADSSGSVDKTELQGLLDDIAQKTGVSNSNSTDELFSQIDSNSDGSLSQDELGQGMKSIMPPPPSTMDFAQSRSDSSTSSAGNGDDLFSKLDTDGSGAVSQDELQALLDKVASDHGTNSTLATSSGDMFAKLDTDGNGSLSQTEFKAGGPQKGQAPQGAGGMPPPPPPGGAMGSKSTDSTSYDPLDTNEDGVVSAEERMAATTSNDSLQALFKAIDTDGDSKISSSESETFTQELTAQYNAASTSAQEKARSDLSQLVMQAYQQIASGLSPRSQSSSLNALA